MTEVQRHTINKLELNIILPTDTPQDKAVDISNELYNKHFAETIERVLGGFSEQENIIINEINIDLGEISPEDIPSALESILREKIMAYMSFSSSVDQINSPVISLEDAIVNSFLEYIETGYTELNIAGKSYTLMDVAKAGGAMIISNEETLMRLHDIFSYNAFPILRFNDITDDTILIAIIEKMLEISHISISKHTSSLLKSWPHDSLAMALFASIYAPSTLHVFLFSEDAEEISNNFTNIYSELKYELRAYHSSAKTRSLIKLSLESFIVKISPNRVPDKILSAEHFSKTLSTATDTKEELYLVNNKYLLQESSDCSISENISSISSSDTIFSQVEKDNIEDLYLENASEPILADTTILKSTKGNDHIEDTIIDLFDNTSRQLINDDSSIESKIENKAVPHNDYTELSVSDKDGHISSETSAVSQAKSDNFEDLYLKKSSIKDLYENSALEPTMDELPKENIKENNKDNKIDNQGDLHSERFEDKQIEQAEGVERSDKLITTQKEVLQKENVITTNISKIVDLNADKVLPLGDENELIVHTKDKWTTNFSDNSLQKIQNPVNENISGASDNHISDRVAEDNDKASTTAMQNSSHEQINSLELDYEEQSKTEYTNTEQLVHRLEPIQDIGQVIHKYANNLYDIIDPYEWMRIDRRIHTSDAGLVLLNPFITVFFTRLGLTQEDNSFETIQQRMRAAHLLRVIAFGSEEDHDDCKLVLCKILCGISPDVPCFTDFTPTEQECEEIDSLIANVCEYWSILRGTSTNGFRQTFLQRHGTIEKDDAGWLVRVEGKTLDILMEDLPWGISTFVLPWTRPFFVDWQKSI